MLKEYILVDIETTGLCKHKHAITEIAAVKIKNNKIVKKFHSLINSEQYIPSFITRITGIDDELVKNAPKINEIIHKFLDFLKDEIIVAHNLRLIMNF